MFENTPDDLNGFYGDVTLVDGEMLRRVLVIDAGDTWIAIQAQSGEERRLPKGGIRSFKVLPSPPWARSRQSGKEKAEPGSQ